MENKSTEVSLSAHSKIVKEIVDHQPVVIFTKENMDAYKPLTLVILPPVIFIGGPTRQRITGSKQGAWDPEISVSVINAVRVPVDEGLDDIGMKTINVVINMECDGKAS